MILQVQRVSKTYRTAGKNVQALKEASLQVSAGELLAVHGPSGCGKSTLLLCCGGLLGHDDGGQITVDGLNPYSLDHRQRAAFRAEKVGFVFQQFHLIPYLDVLDNVLAASIARSPSASRERAMSLLERVGMRDRMQHLPGELSVGERQRVALARAVLNDPPLILADEPTGNLDPENAHVVFQTLRDYAENGKAVLLVTHERGLLSAVHRALRLHRGRLE